MGGVFRQLYHPTMKKMIEFFEHRAQIEITRPILSNNPQNFSNLKDKHASGHKPHPPRAFHASSPNIQSPSLKTQNKQGILSHKPCPIYQRKDHGIYTCPQFLKLAPQERINEAKNAFLCLNCLRSNHRLIDCRLRGCRYCNKQHNSLLHIDQQ